MTRTSKYLNQDTIAALQSFQIEKIVREITDYLDTNNKMNTVLNVDVIILVWLRVVLPTLVSKCFVVKNADNVLLWTAFSLLFIFTKTNPNGISLSCSVSPKEITAKINVNERNVFIMRHKLLVSLKTEEYPK